MLSVCGVNCQSDCCSFGTECNGCNELAGKVSWAVFYDTDTCPIYACVAVKHLTTCAACGLAPCDVWNSTRNPDASDEEFNRDIASRLSNLSQLSK